MKYCLRFGIVIWLICGAFLFSQNKSASTEEKPQPTGSNSDREIGPIEVLSNTTGVDFTAYVQAALKRIKPNWYDSVPESARLPTSKRGVVSITFHILKDGSVTDIKVEESSGDASLDGAAWGGISASNPFLPLPVEFSGQYLRLRVRFYYNFDAARPPYTQEQSALRVKCSPYVNTKVEDLESKRVPLPPHECDGVLAWMRDRRVENLYTAEKTPH